MLVVNVLVIYTLSNENKMIYEKEVNSLAFHQLTHLLISFTINICKQCEK